jgi:hypothetical protein
MVSSENEKALQAANMAYEPFGPPQDWAERVAVEDWGGYLTAMLAQRESADAEDFARAIQASARAAARDTGAIEGLYEVRAGFTISAWFQEGPWQLELEEHRGTPAELIADQLEAYQMALDVATGSHPVNEAWIRQLHQVACRHQETYKVQTAAGPQEHPLTKGTYKEAPNHVVQPDGSVFSYAPVSETRPEMARFVAALQSSGFDALDPANQAAFAHHAFIRIHPFADGNGRVARILASTFLARDASIPLVIYADQRGPYLNALRLADRGDRRVFTHFIASRGIDAMADVTILLRAAALPEPEVALRDLRDLYFGYGDLAHVELDQIALRLMTTFTEQMTARLEAIEAALPAGGRIGITGLAGQANVDRSWRSPSTGHAGFRLHIGVPEPAAADGIADFTVMVTREKVGEFAYQLRRAPADVLNFRLEDLHPAITSSAEQRLVAFGEESLRRVLFSVLSQAAARLREGNL